MELIRRQNRHFTITPAGEHFYTHSKAILEQAEHLVRETQQLGNDQKRQLRIGYLRCYSGLELHQAIAAFSPGPSGGGPQHCQRHPRGAL